MTLGRTVQHRLEYAAFLVVYALILVLPLRLVLAGTRGLARIVFLCWRNRRRIALDNLRAAGICPTERDVRRLAAEAFESFAVMVVETIIARRRLNSANYADYVTFHFSPGAEALLKGPKRGVIVASGHLGNWEVAARAVSLHKPMCVVYRPFKNPYLEKLAHAGRSGENLRLVSRLEAEPMRFLKALHAGEVVALMIDQRIQHHGVQVQFFGRPAWTTKTVAMMHLTTRAPLVVAAAVRTGPLRYEVHAVGPVECPRTGDREKDAFDLTQALTAEIEKLVRLYPGQYLWGHRRWETGTR